MATAVTVLGLTALTTVLSDDVLPIVDVHDITQSAGGSTKKITVANLFAPYLPLTGGTLSGSLSIGTTLAVTGAVTLSNTLSVGSTLALSGALTGLTAVFSSTLGVTGATTLAACSSTAFSGPLTGNVTGNASGSAGSVAAANITGATLAAGVAASSLTSVGTLASLGVTGTSTLGNVNAQSLTATAITSSGALSVTTDFAHKGSNAGFYNTTARAKPTITGPINTADTLAQSLAAILVELGLLSTTTAAGSYFVT